MNNRDVALNYLASFATADPDKVVRLVTDDFENIQVSELGRGCKGASAYRERLHTFLQQFQKLAYQVNELIVDGDKVAAAYTMSFVDNGRDIRIEGVMLLTIRDQRIAIRKDYWDGLSYQAQVGLA